MWTTLTVDDDVAASLKTESQRAGRPFREIVNETLPRGLEIRGAAARRAFKVKPGLSLDNITELIEHVAGPLHQ